MNGKIGLLIVSGLLLFLGVHLLQAEEAHGPRIKFESTEFDFGEIREGDKVTHIYEFKNVGDDTLVIERIKTS